jgi:predicted amidophosphoribosyltransferase
MFYNICPLCGSHLDPSEVCDCKKELEQRNQPPEQAEAKKNKEVTSSGKYIQQHF